MKKAIILRGLPGSGKSTIAAILAMGAAASEKNPHSSSEVHSTDDYFYEGDKYRFDPSKLGEYHSANLGAFIYSCKKGVPMVILDNTCTQHWEYEKYVEAAESHGYQVHIIAVGDFDVDKCFERNTHGVPKESIQKMKERWEM